MNRRTRIAAVVALVLTLAACLSKEDLTASGKAIDTFHRAYNAGDFGAMYDAADAELKAADTKEEFVSFLKAVRGKMGRVESTRRISFNSMVSTSGSRITLVQESKFKAGTATEKFVWKMDGKAARLVSYNINSRQLVVQ